MLYVGSLDLFVFERGIGAAVQNEGTSWSARVFGKAKRLDCDWTAEATSQAQGDSASSEHLRYQRPQ